MTLGVALDDDLEVLNQILAGNRSDAENAECTTALSVTYGEQFEMAPSDLMDVEKNGWAIAGPEAFPSVMRLRAGQRLVQPSLDDVKLLTACLAALPVFLGTKKPLSTTVDVGGEKFPISITVHKRHQLWSWFGKSR